MLVLTINQYLFSNVTKPSVRRNYHDESQLNNLFMDRYYTLLPIKSSTYKLMKCIFYYTIRHFVSY